MTTKDLKLLFLLSEFVQVQGYHVRYRLAEEADNDKEGFQDPTAFSLTNIH